MTHRKRKGLVIGCGVGLGLVVLLVLLAALGGPLAVRLGLKPVCIQGDWPQVRIVSCPEPAAAAAVVTPWPLPTLSGQTPVPIIVDDDGSPDGMIALLYFLRNPLFEVKAVTISQGEAHPDVFAPHVSQLLAGLGKADIPVGAGRGTPLAGDNAFPEPWREGSDAFWGISLPAAPVPTEPVPAAELIAQTIRGSAEPMAVFVSGTHTNLAEALRLDPGIADKIRGVYVMGGSVHAPGNIHAEWPQLDNEVAEWNIWADALAAGEVFDAGLPLHLIPLDATRQVLWTEADAARWASSGSEDGRLAAGLLRALLSMSPEGVAYVWDVVAAGAATDARLCPETSLSLDVVTAAGPEQGRMVIAEGPPNVAVCLTPNAAQTKARVEDILIGAAVDK